MSGDVSNLIGLGMAPALAGIVGGKWATVAGAGSAYTDTTACTTKYVLATGANGTVGVTMKATGIGEISIIKNQDNAVLKVYPPSGCTFNGGSANAAVSIAAYAAAIIIGRTAADYIALEAAAA